MNSIKTSNMFYKDNPLINNLVKAPPLDGYLEVAQHSAGWQINFKNEKLGMDHVLHTGLTEAQGLDYALLYEHSGDPARNENWRLLDAGIDQPDYIVNAYFSTLRTGQYAPSLMITRQLSALPRLQFVDALPPMNKFVKEVVRDLVHDPKTTHVVGQTRDDKSKLDLLRVSKDDITNIGVVGFDDGRRILDCVERCRPKPRNLFRAHCHHSYILPMAMEMTAPQREFPFPLPPFDSLGPSGLQVN